MFCFLTFQLVTYELGFQAMYQYYQVMICLLKFDFFAFTGVTMQVRVLLSAMLIVLTAL